VSGTVGAVHPAFLATRGIDVDLDDVLDRRVYGVLCTQNDDGSPHLVPVMFLRDRGRLVVETGRATRKARNVVARRHATLLVQTPDASWVAGSGPARLVPATSEPELREAMRTKYLTAAGRVACDALLDEMDDSLVVVEPAHWLSWSIGRFMASLAAQGVDLSGADGWFRADD
jgi:hypothetical protein